MSNKPIDAVLRSLSGNAKKPVVSVVGYIPVAKGMFKIVADLVHTATSSGDEELMREAILDTFKGRLEPVRHSFQTVSANSFNERVMGIVAATKKILPVSTEKMPEGFTALSANMFMDKEHEMWSLHKTEAGNILVHTNGLDDDLSLADMLRSMSSNRISPSERETMIAYCSNVSRHVEGGDYVSYVSNTNVVQLGFVAACTDDNRSVVVPQVNPDMEEVVPNEAILDIHDTSDAPDVQFSEEEQVQLSMSSARSVSLNEILAYYRKVYARSSLYFEEFAKRLRSAGKYA